MDNQNPYGGGGQPPGYPGSGYGGGAPGGVPLGMTGTLDVGDVLSTTFRTIGSAFVPILAGGLVAVLPTVIVLFACQVAMYFAIDSMGPPSPDQIMNMLMVGVPIYFIVVLVLMAAQSVGQGAIVYSVVEQLSGRAPQIGPALRVGFARAFWVFLAQLLVTFALLIPLAMCFVPGFVLWTLFFSVVMPVCIVEKLGPIDSISRSIQLGEGQRLTVFLVFLVAVIGWIVCFFCILGPISGVIGAASAISAQAAGGMPNPLGFGQILNQIIGLPFNVAFSMIFSTMIAVVYARLRGLRDGVDAQALASVFS